jgi:hypothetical protein
VALTTTMSSLKERAGVKGGVACGFAVVLASAGHGGMASRRVSPDRCPVWCGLAVRVKDLAA